MKGKSITQLHIANEDNLMIQQNIIGMQCFDIKYNAYYYDENSFKITRISFLFSKSIS